MSPLVPVSGQTPSYLRDTSSPVNIPLGPNLPSALSGSPKEGKSQETGNKSVRQTFEVVKKKNGRDDKEEGIKVSVVDPI